MKEPLPDTDQKTENKIPGTPEGQPGYGPLHVASAEETLKAQKEAEAEAVKALEPKPDPRLTTLEHYLNDIFEDARRFKEDETEIQAVMLDNLLRKNGKYSQKKLKQIKTAGSSEAYLGMTGIKCRAFEAFVHDVYMNAKRKRTWTLKPTPIVTIPDPDRQRIKSTVLAAAADEEQNLSPTAAYEMASELRAKVIEREYELALKKAENMSRLVHDQLIEGGWVKAMSDGILDLSTMKAMVIKGPIIRKRKVRAGWKDGKIQYEVKTVATFERVSPLDLYPSRYSDCVDGPPLCEKVNIDRGSLAANRAMPGYQQAAIEEILNAPASVPSPSSLASERETVETKDNIEASPSVDTKVAGSILPGVEYWCSCRGRDLIEMGIVKDAKDNPIDVFLDYEINAITASGGKIVFLAFNEDELNKRPYSVTGFAKEIGGFWYRSIPELLKDPQDIVNAATRAMVNNLGFSSGPQVIINDINKLAGGEDLDGIYPLKIWQGNGSGINNGQKLVEFFQIDSRSSEMIAVIEEFMKLADALIEMPSYTYGNDKVAGAGRTSGGLSMLMSASSRGMKRIILDLDRRIFQNVVEMTADYNLQTSEDESIKGDMNFYSEGVISLIMREQLSERRMSFLQSTQNEFDMKIIGMDGRAKILSDAIESLESDYDDILPTEEKIERLIVQEEKLQEQAIRENEIKIQEAQDLAQREEELQMQTVQLEMSKLDVERRKQDLEFKAKERELDIRAEKQNNETIEKIAGLDDSNASDEKPTEKATEKPVKEAANAEA